MDSAIEKELMYDFLIMELTEEILPKMSWGQLDALKYAVEEQLEKFEYEQQEIYS